MQQKRQHRRLCFRRSPASRTVVFRAEDEAQTRDPQLGRLMLYQLSYFRKFRFSVPRRAVSAKIYRIGATPLARRRFAATSEGFATPTGFLKWEVMDSNHRRRTPADLQSAPFDRSGNFPFFSSEEVSSRRAFQTKAPSSSPIPLSRVPKLIRPSSFPAPDSRPRASQSSDSFARFPLGPLASAFRADGGIRTPDQLITNQLLWPTELHRQNQPFWIAKVGIKN